MRRRARTGWNSSITVSSGLDMAAYVVREHKHCGEMGKAGVDACLNTRAGHFPKGVAGCVSATGKEVA